MNKHRMHDDVNQPVQMLGVQMLADERQTAGRINTDHVNVAVKCYLNVNSNLNRRGISIYSSRV